MGEAQPKVDEILTMTSNPDMFSMKSLVTMLAVGILFVFFLMCLQIVAGNVGLGPHFWVAGVLALSFLTIFGALLSGIWSNREKKKRLANDAEANLRKLQDEGFSESELKSVATFVNGAPEIRLKFLEDAKEFQLEKKEFLAFIDEFDKLCPVETWQSKVRALALFVSILAAFFGTVLIFH
jgi:hypothetical protein